MLVRVADRGQVALPKALRERLGIVSGTMRSFEAENGRLIVGKAETIDKLTAIYGRFGRGRRTDAVVEELRGEQ